ncbi:hypothetical protein TKK_0003140 [Trichogramma kaykai]
MAESGGCFDYMNFRKHLDDCVSITKDYSSEPHKFLRKLFYSMVDWKCQLPNLRDFFGREEIEPLLSNSINCRCGGEDDQRVERLIDLVARTGYKDEPRSEVDEDNHGKPLLLRRTTPVHHAAKCGLTQGVKDLFKIYDRFDVNYADESGLTHFHVACQYGCRDVVRKFLNLGQDPDCPVDSPLLLALKNNHKDVFELLLRHGANPNTTDEDGSSPLHIICQRGYDDDDDAMQWIFKICDDVQQTLQVDAKDKSGRTPLQWAVANLLPKTVDVLLARGADLSSFVFPTEDYFGSKFTPNDKITRRTRCTNYALFIVNILGRRGYELSRDDALTIVELLARLGMTRRHSIYTAEVDGDKDDCYRCGTNRYRPRNRWCCADCLFHILRRFLRRWAIEFLSTSRCPGLPIHCCEKIVDGLENEDFRSICLAASGHKIKNESSSELYSLDKKM